MADTAEKVFKDGLTPFNWFQKDNKLKFKVPVYQRLFAWDTPQFDRLLSDLQEWKKKNDEGPYYLGIITVVKQGDSFILIDGQQRLTVIAILIGMFKTCFEDLPEKITDYLDYEARPDDKNALETIWKNGSEWIKCKTEDELNEILEKNHIVSDSMRSFIRHIYKKKIKEKENEWKTVIENDLFTHLTLLISKLPDNYEDGLELQNEYFEKMNSAGKQLEPHEILKVRVCQEEIDFENWNFIEDFTKKFSEKKSPSDKGKSGNDNAQTKSSGGLSQDKGSTGNNTNNETPSYSLLQIVDGERDPKEKNAISVISDLKGTEKETIKFKETSEKRLSVEKWRPALIDFPMFLLHVLHILEKSDRDLPSDSHSLLKCFDGKVGDDETRRRFVVTMREYRKFLDEWVIHKDVDSCEQEVIDNEINSDVSKFSYWSSENNMEIKTIGKSEDDIISKELKQIQMALAAVGGQNQKWMIDAFSYFENKEKDPSLLLNYHVRQLVSQFVNKDNKDFFVEITKRVDAEWPDNFMTYDDKVPHALFVCLDYFLWLLARTKETPPAPTGKLRDDVFTMKDGNWETVEDYLKEGSNDREAITCFIPKAHRSVEHFHPQTDDNSTHKKEWNELINDKTPHPQKNMFGNLALISAGRNSEYGNYSVDEKAARIKRLVYQKDLESIKLYLMMKECEGNDANWTPDYARTHAKKMLDVLKWGIRHYGINIENIRLCHNKWLIFDEK